MWIYGGNSSPVHQLQMNCHKMFFLYLEIIVLSLSLIEQEVEIISPKLRFHRKLAPETHSTFILVYVFIDIG